MANPIFRWMQSDKAEQIIKTIESKLYWQLPSSITSGEDLNAMALPYGDTALMLLLQEDRAEPYLHLVHHKPFDPDIQNDQGYNALMIAARKNNVGAMAELIKAGANVNLRTRHDHTAIHEVIENKNLEALELLIKGKANLEIKNLDSETPLYIAVGHHFVEGVQLLLEKGADPNVVCSSVSVLSYAKSTGNQRVINLLEHAVEQRPPAVYLDAPIIP